ncbi:glycoside hydrolase family 88 protein [Cohnella cellulosilytica]|uniref:Glycoside hydrolase family 88 protein n=1 Tax=Cohnella cellulosilytica TaxID=986710 RepID=A0ABW2F8R2_9BACL
MIPDFVNKEALTELIDRIVDRTFKMDFTWDWPGGVAYFGVAEAYEATGNASYLEKLRNWADERLEEGLPPFTVNAMAVGHLLLTLHQATEDRRYLEAAERMADYLLKEAPRLPNGVFEHTVGEGFKFPQQAWVDTMMMAGYFLVRIGSRLQRSDYLEEGLRQYHGHEELLQDGTTNLYYHGWDEASQSHLSAVFWARGNAWAALTMAGALKHVKVQHPSYMMIDGSLRDQLSALVRLQDETGLWPTVLNDPESYAETSASAGIAAALASRGALYRRQTERALAGIVARVAEDGTVTGVSAGTAVMDDADGYKGISVKRIQGWGQGLTLAFLSRLLKTEG